MDEATIKGALLTWVKRETKITVIFARQDTPRPKFPYATIWAPLGGVRIGSFDEIRANQDNTGFEQVGNRTTTISLNIYGSGANTLMSKLRDSLDWPGTREEFATAGIAVVGESGPQDLSAFEDTKNVERSQLDLKLSYAIIRVPDEDRTVYSIDEVVATAEDMPNEDSDDIVITVGDAG